MTTMPADQCDQFTVTTANLRSVADALSSRAEQSRQLAGRAKDADVGTKSWGLLGLSLGLYAGYTSARDTADRSVREVTSFLTDAQTALQSTAQSYDAADQAGRQLFRTISDGTGGSAG
jgi:uncharacterized protein YukE